MWKKISMLLCAVGVIGCIGCATPDTGDSSNDMDYLQCNGTSKNQMAEIESGFFYMKDEFLYYMDRANMDSWLPVCNKPDCQHINKKCNAYLPSYDHIVQQNGKLYGISRNAGEIPYIFEIATDGSGICQEYEIPLVMEEDCYISGYSRAISQNQLVIAYEYMNEQGAEISSLACMKDDKLTVLHTSEDDCNVISANTYWGIRGDDVYTLGISKELGLDVMTTLWRIDEESYERINLPETINLYEISGSYLSGDTFTYFVPNEGFYEWDLNSGVSTLIYENQLENSKAYIMTEDYILEFNCYKGNRSENVYLKFYNGEEWLDVTLPDDVKKSHSTFGPLSVASDRVFLKQSTGEFEQCYYFMLADDTPELVACGTFGEMPEGLEGEEETIETTEQGNMEAITVFDNEYGLFKIIGHHVEEDDYVLEVYCDFKDVTKYCKVNLVVSSINGIQANSSYYFDSKMFKEHKIDPNIWFYGEEQLKAHGISDIYQFDDYTDIELLFSIEDYDTGEMMEEKTIHYYPQGEENAMKYVREVQPEDVVLFDNEYVTLRITKYEQRMIPNDTAQLFIENKTNEDIQFCMESISINGLMPFDVNGIRTDDFDNFIVFAGKSYFQYLSLFDEDFIKNSGITDTGKIEFLLKAYPDSLKLAEVETFIMDEYFVVYPNGEENEKQYVRETQNTDVVLMDNEYVTLILTGYEDFLKTLSWQENIKNGLVNLHYINKTDEIIAVRIEKSSANGTMDSSYTSYLSDVYLLPQNSSNFIVNNHIARLSRYGITSLSEMELLFRVFPYGGGEMGEDLAMERVTLYPEGEHNAESYSREEQSTDRVLLDNEFVTVIHTGYETDTIAQMYIVNKTKDDIRFQFQPLATNGMEEDIEETYMFAGTCAIYEINTEIRLDSSDTTKDKESEFLFRAYGFDYIEGRVGEEIVSETIIIEPE